MTQWQHHRAAQTQANIAICRRPPRLPNGLGLSSGLSYACDIGLQQSAHTALGDCAQVWPDIQLVVPFEPTLPETV